MDIGPERIDIVYAVEYYDKVRKKRFTTSYKMTLETAIAHFVDTEDWKIVGWSMEERRCGGKPQVNPTSRYM